MTKKRVLIVFPNEWDRRQLKACEADWSSRYDVVWGDPTDEDCPWDLDLIEYVDRAVEQYGGRIDGVFSSSDYPGAVVASVIAERLSLPGSPPNGVLRASHKYKSRVAQARSIPEATPPFVLIDPERPTSPFYPCFVKPIKGAFSLHTRRVHDDAELAAFLDSPSVVEFRRTYVHMFNQLLRAFSDITVDSGWFVAEAVLSGHQVTAEVFVHDGEHTVIGISDSVMVEGKPSFARFDYPSRLAPEVLARIGEAAVRVGTQLGLNHGLYNVELFHDEPADRVWIIEINPRLCGQFADLYDKVHGLNTYEIALDLAVGRAPQFEPGRGAFDHATSFPLRVFEPVTVRRAPTAAAVRETESSSPGTLVWLECKEGQDLADFEAAEDGSSYRYAVVNLGADDAAGAIAKLADVRKNLGFDLVPLAR